MNNGNSKTKLAQRAKTQARDSRGHFIPKAQLTAPVVVEPDEDEDDLYEDDDDTTSSSGGCGSW